MSTTLLHTDSGHVNIPRGGTDRPLRLLFVKHDLGFPRSRGHDIRGYNVMRALAQLGHQIGLLTIEEPSSRALDGLRLDWRGTLGSIRSDGVPPPPLPRLQRSFASYFGVTEDHMIAVAAAARAYEADAVIGMGPDMPPYLAATSAARIWYVGDEWVSHYSSLAKPTRPNTWAHLKTAAVWGLYERTFARSLDRIWVVSDREARHMRRWAATDRVDALPNGVDADYFVPMALPEQPRTAIFWGRLDFAPNLQALQWFCREVWPELHRRYPDSALRIIGFNAGDEARALAQGAGVTLSPDLADVRGVVSEHAVAVMPFNSGGGVKNKLLEAASMGKAVVCSPLSCNGLRGDPPLVVTEFSGGAWVAAISRLWEDAGARVRLGEQAREWAVREHSWTRTAEDAVHALRTRVPVDSPRVRQSVSVPAGDPVKPHRVARQRALRLLFVARDLHYPRSRGHDICGYYMMRALGQMGQSIGLLTIEEPSAEAVAGLNLEWRGTLPSVPSVSQPAPQLSRLQSSFASYFGVPRDSMLRVASAAGLFGADAIIGVGPDIPPYLAAASMSRIWYVGDEWVSHYSSLVKPGDLGTWGHLKTAAVWGLYERAFAPTLDDIWVVSDREAHHMRRWAATDRVDAFPNGVDADYFVPMELPERPNTVVFWGRLDFAPNLQALQWFCRKVWPELRRRHPDAAFQIIGFDASAEALELGAIPGVTVTADVEDLRPLVSVNAVVVMPFHSGGGIKNKLLEAASMAKPVVCTAMACHGLQGHPPLTVVDSIGAWVETISRLWDDEQERARLGRQAREWVVREHSWTRTAEDALTGLQTRVLRVANQHRHDWSPNVDVSR